MISSQAPICQQRSPFSKAQSCVKKISTKKLYTGEIISISAVPNEETKKELVVDSY